MVRNLQERDNFEDNGIDGEVIINFPLDKETGLNSGPLASYSEFGKARLDSCYKSRGTY
jgi:hypothetical protein